MECINNGSINNCENISTEWEWLGLLTLSVYCYNNWTSTSTGFQFGLFFNYCKKGNGDQIIVIVQLSGQSLCDFDIYLDIISYVFFNQIVDWK